jgi:hypothetical protein
VTSTARNRLLVTGICLLALVGIGLYGVFPIVRCLDSCFIDYFAIHDAQTAHFEMPDTRLNAWILAWVQHAVFESPTTLFDSNVFYPAKNTLAGSEHLFGVAFQVLPVRLFSGGAVALHQGALVLSFLLLAINSFFFVRWLTGSNWGAVLAGAAAAFMPWRFSELGHLQLLNVQWLPIVWLLTGRILMGPRRRTDALWLTLVATIQMLSSFYLAYLTLLSTGLIAATLWIARRSPLAAALKLAAAFVLPTAIVALSSIPYLSRYSAYRFAESSTTDFASSPGLIASLLKPPLALTADVAGLAPVTYHLPLVVIACALLAFGWWAAPPVEDRREPGPDPGRIRAMTIALWVASAGALVLMLGRTIEVGASTLHLPGYWLAQHVPGFSQMRAEFRWGIVLGLAGPALAGVGVAWLEARMRCIADANHRRLALASIYMLTAGSFAFNIHWFQLPARDAWGDARDVRAAHEALAMLEPGVVLELPWRVHRISTATNGSRYMLGSTLHWNPILNGYTAYVPDSYHFLQRLAQNLPDPIAIENLQRLTDLRWIVVHPERMGRLQKGLWAEAERTGRVQLQQATSEYRIYRFEPAPFANSWLPALLADAPGSTTMTGLSRDAIATTPSKLRIRVRNQMRYEHGSGIPYFATVTIENPSGQSWPGLDIQTEGLVELRYRFFDAAGGLVREATANLDADIAPGAANVAHALVRPPTSDGRFTVRFDLVQRRGDDLHDLGALPAEVVIDVSKRPLLPGNRNPGEHPPRPR